MTLQSLYSRRRPRALNCVHGQKRGLRSENELLTCRGCVGVEHCGNSTIAMHRWVDQFLNKNVDVPFVCHDTELIVMCQRHRSWQIVDMIELVQCVAEQIVEFNATNLGRNHHCECLGPLTSWARQILGPVRTSAITVHKRNSRTLLDAEESTMQTVHRRFPQLL